MNLTGVSVWAFLKKIFYECTMLKGVTLVSCMDLIFFLLPFNALVLMEKATPQAKATSHKPRSPAKTGRYENVFMKHFVFF